MTPPTAREERMPTWGKFMVQALIVAGVGGIIMGWAILWLAHRSAKGGEDDN